MEGHGRAAAVCANVYEVVQMLDCRAVRNRVGRRVACTRMVGLRRGTRLLRSSSFLLKRGAALPPRWCRGCMSRPPGTGPERSRPRFAVFLSRGQPMPSDQAPIPVGPMWDWQPACRPRVPCRPTPAAPHRPRPVASSPVDMQRRNRARSTSVQHACPAIPGRRYPSPVLHTPPRGGGSFGKNPESRAGCNCAARIAAGAGTMRQHRRRRSGPDRGCGRRPGESGKDDQTSARSSCPPTPYVCMCCGEPTD